jgi:hypothetical protein
MARSRAARAKVLEELCKYPIIQIACQRAGVSRATYYRWVRDDPAFARSAEDALSAGRDVINDSAESKLIGSIKDGAMTAIRFWLVHNHERYKKSARSKGTRRFGFADLLLRARKSQEQRKGPEH